MNFLVFSGVERIYNVCQYILYNHWVTGAYTVIVGEIVTSIDSDTWMAPWKNLLGACLSCL